MNPSSPDIRKTILVVDGTALVRQLVVDALAFSGGYNILTAECGSCALQQSIEFKGEIHLLLTALSISGMSGIELATAMTIGRPNLNVVIMSGLPESTLVLRKHWHFLPKPFGALQLRALVGRLVFPD